MLLSCFLLFVGQSQLANAKVEVDKNPDIQIDLKVKADNANAKIAKQTAINDGLKQSFYQAITQLSPKNARAIYRNLVASKKGEADLTPYLESYTIKSETAKSGVYEADITYVFNKEKLEKIIGIEHGIASDADAAPTGEGLLIIPIYEVGGQLLLFEQGNQWRYAFNKVALETGKGELVMPFGDVRDQGVINQQSVLAGEKNSLIQMAKRYGTRNVVIALAKAKIDGAEPFLQVTLYQAGGNVSDAIILNFKANSATETLELLLDRTANEVAIKLLKSIADYSLFGQSEANKIKAIVLRAEFNTGKEWRYMLEGLRNLPNLERLDLGAVGLNAAQATILYKGDANVMRGAMVQRGFEIDDKSHEYWVVRLLAGIAR